MFSKQQLAALAPNVGDNIVIHDTESRKALFFVREANGFRMKKAWNVRSRGVRVKATDRVFHHQNGTFVRVSNVVAPFRVE